VEREQRLVWNLGYTYTDAKEVGSLTSSTASSGWGYQYSQCQRGNAEHLALPDQDRLSGSLNWKHKFFGDYETKVGLVYEGRSGRPYSYIYVNDANGDGRSGNDLFYVPRRGDVLFGALNATASSPPMRRWRRSSSTGWRSPQLAKYAGRWLGQRFRTGWINTFDVRISQQLPGFMKGHKSEIWLDIQNVGNMLNKKWGNIYDYGFYANAVLPPCRAVPGQVRVQLHRRGCRAWPTRC
jgi:hypothetical protein